jgi:phage tail sheath protein FI
MPVTTSYPGIYIEELPATSHAIVPAPTSIAAFVGYTHPFKTAAFGDAVLVQSLTEYEHHFGGLFHSGAVRNDLAYAVYQFFLNGGSQAYVIGLQPDAAVIAESRTIAPFVFTAREPTDLVPMTVTVSNARASVSGGAIDTVDVEAVYGTRVEIYRGVNVIAADPKFVEKVIGTANQPKSDLITVGPALGGYGAAIVPGSATLASVWGGVVLDPNEFNKVFDPERPLDKVDIFNILVLPGISDAGILSTAIAYAERKRAYVIFDPPYNAASDDDPTNGNNLLTPMDVAFEAYPRSINAAIYFPYLRCSDPITGGQIELAPSGTVAGLYAQTDNDRGVWKAPAGLAVVAKNVGGVTGRGRMTDLRQGVLNLKGVNCMRSFPNVGTVVYGARGVVAANPALAQWKYVPVRRMALFIESSLYRNLGWAIFEPNDEPLWRALRSSITDFMMSLFRQGAFQGSTPSQAFLVKCDSGTTTQVDIDLGQVNILVGFSPLKPAEFVIVKITQLAGQAQS